nr:monocarboxylate transporter 12-like isoform X1 [Rhipicephalus microplus]XP_037290432.1 monocarboxylate transporter 12-like isoform X1 [Rhipicephalus microplus]XP_037290433.1 monocarboxylate transporter 12-like isoform X1 [Rhipicephalus microplus]
MSGAVHLRRVTVDTCWSVPVLAALMTLLVCMPSSYMGLVFVYVVEDYGVSRALASWTQTGLFVAVHLSGLLVGALQQRISPPRIALLSGLVASAGLIASSFTKDIILVALTLGILYGLGMGMFLMSVSIYNIMLFEKYKGTAMSMTFLAWGIAGLYGPVLLYKLRESYALQGGLLICGGLLLNSVPLALLLNNPPGTDFSNLKYAISNCLYRRTAVSARSVKATALPLDEPSDLAVTSVPEKMQSEVDVHCQDLPATGSLHRTDIEYTATDRLGSKIEAEDCSVFVTTSQNGSPSRSRLQSLLELLRTPAFYVFLATTVVSEYSLVSIGTTIVDYAKDKVIELSVATQLMIFGAVGHILARLTIVPLSDCAKGSRLPMYAGAFACEAVSAAAMPHVCSIAALTVLRVLESLAQGFILSVRTILLAQYLGIERVAACSGVFGLAMIPVSLSSPAILGFFRDIIGSYDPFYHMMGALNATMAGLLFMFFLYDWRHARKP